MCVKEFYGYDCGHCSIPVLRQCPLSASNPMFPVCALPAERPVYAKENCHPCSRIVWNAKVLKEEEEHRFRHLRGECGCETVFNGEDREKKVRPRPGKGKGKGKGKVSRGGSTSESYGTRHDSEEATGLEVILAGETGSAVTREEWEPEAQLAAYDYTGYYYDQNHTYVADAYDAGGEVMGAGMKWYPGEMLAYQTNAFAYYPRAASEPNPKTTDDAENNNNLEAQQPTVVSSEMAEPNLP